MRMITYACLQLGGTSPSARTSNAPRDEAPVTGDDALGASGVTSESGSSPAEPQIADLDEAIALLRGYLSHGSGFADAPDLIDRSSRPIDAIVILVCDEIEDEDGHVDETSDVAEHKDEAMVAAATAPAAIDDAPPSAAQPEADPVKDSANAQAGDASVRYRFSLQTLWRSEALDEAALIKALDVELALSICHTTVDIFTDESDCQLLYLRALSLRLPVMVLGGMPTPEGRKFGDRVLEAGTDLQKAGFAQICDILGIPFVSALITHLESSRHESAPICLTGAGEIYTAALWQEVMLLQHPQEPERARRAWRAFEDWAAADPARVHLMPLFGADHAERG